VARFLGALPPEALEKLLKEGPNEGWPRKGEVKQGNGGLTSWFYGEVEDGVMLSEAAYPREQWAELGIPDGAKDHARSLCDGVRRWLSALMEEGSVQAVRKVPEVQDLDSFTRMRALLLGGWQDATGQLRLFRSVAHARSASEEFAELAAGLQSGSGMGNVGIWRKLQRLYRELYMAAERRTKTRDRVRCMRRALQMRGRLLHEDTPPNWPAGAKASVKPGVYWQPENSHNMLSYDCFTVDPRELAQGRSRVIGAKGVPQEAVSDPLLDKAVGAMPKMFFGLACHPRYGARVWLYYTGSSGGQRGADAWEDARYWYDEPEMTPEIRQQIADRGHCNFPEAIQQKAGAVFGQFSASKFLVRLCC
jgi:hypothetical protein